VDALGRQFKKPIAIDDHIEMFQEEAANERLEVVTLNLASKFYEIKNVVGREDLIEHLLLELARELVQRKELRRLENLKKVQSCYM